MIESPGISVKNNEKEAPKGLQVNIKTDNCSYLHTISPGQRWTDLEREKLEQMTRGRRKKITSGIQI